MAAAIGFLLDDAAAEGVEPYMQIDLDEYEPEDQLEGLAFAAGVVVDEVNGRLWIADTAHHRVLALPWPGDRDRHVVEKVFGTGRPGAADGQGDAASFYDPVSLALDGSDVLVADSGNHLLRRIVWPRIASRRCSVPRAPWSTSRRRDRVVASRSTRHSA